MNNKKFLEVIKDSFYTYLNTSSRSNKKLKVLHGAIADDLKNRLGDEYEIHSLGYGADKEINMAGKYMDKKVDIAITKKGNKEVISAIALKFIMRNYKQNSNNYFENMLGETANIRSHGQPYFQILIMPTSIPYFKKGAEFSRYEKVTEENIAKYIHISKEDISKYMYTPNRMLIYLVNMSAEPPETIKDYDDYKEFYLENSGFEIRENTTTYSFGSSVIYNDYEGFINKVCDDIIHL